MKSFRWKSREYPIKYDEHGQSARQRAFKEFDNEKRPAEVIEVVDISLKTACRYFADWKKKPEDLNLHCKGLRSRVRNDSEFSDPLVDTLVEYLGMPREEVIARLLKPWSIKQFIMGKWPNPKKERAQSAQESRLRAALDIVGLLEYRGIPPDETRAKLKKIIEDALKKKDD